MKRANNKRSYLAQEYLFTYCDNCNSLLEGHIPNPIPAYWDEDTQFIAYILTGYPVAKKDEYVMPAVSNTFTIDQTTWTTTGTNYIITWSQAGTAKLYGVK